MTNNMNISFADSDDPQARQTNETVYMLYSRDPVRTPFQWDETDFAGFTESTTTKTWLPVHENYKTQNLKAQKVAAKSTFKLYQEMIKLRKSNHALQMGDFSSKAVSETVYGFTRHVDGEDAVSVFINLGGATTVSLKDLIGDYFHGNTKAKVLLVNNNSTLVVNSTIADPTKIQLGPYDAVVLEISSATKTVVSMLLLVCTLVKLIF